MNNRFTQLIKEAKSAILNEEEKSQIRENLISFMETNPTRKKERIHLHRIGEIFSLHFSRAMAPAFILLIIVGGGVSYTAEGSLPGDTLYPIKLRLNEGARSLVTFTDEGKLTWEVERTQRRLKEAERLALKGDLDASKSVAIASYLDEYIENIQRHSSSLEQSQNAEAAIEANTYLEASFRAHTRILEFVSQNGEEFDVIVEKIQIKQDEAQVSAVPGEAAMFEAAVTEDAVGTLKAQKESVATRLEVQQAALEEKIIREVASELGISIPLKEIYPVNAQGEPDRE